MPRHNYATNMPKKNAASSPVDPAAYDTLLEVLISWTEVQPKKHLYGFLEPQEVGVRTPSTIEGLGVRVVENLTYESVLLKVKALAYQMKHEWHLKPKDRVILCFPPGTDFLVAFLGCLWAGVIAVPVPAPRPEKLDLDLPKMQHVLKDSGACAVLTITGYLWSMRAHGFCTIKGMVSCKRQRAGCCDRLDGVSWYSTTVFGLIVHEPRSFGSSNS